MDSIQEKYTILLSKNSSQIWADPNFHLILIEHERKDPHAISLEVIDYKKGIKVLDDIVISQDTFITIQHVENGNIVIQKYISSSHQLPIPNGFFIYSIFEKKIITNYPSLYFLYQIDNEIIASYQQLENILYKKINLTNSTIENISPEIAFQFNKPLAPITFPELYIEGDPYFEQVASFLLIHYNIQAQELIYYMEHPPFIIVSCYIWKENERKNKVMIIDIEKKYFQEEEIFLTTGISFYRIKNQLFIINKKNQLMSYEF